MGTKACSICEVTKASNSQTFSTIKEMEDSFKKYSENNLLGLYGRQIQITIEKLFTLEQFHLCDLIIKLSSEKQTEARDQLLRDIEGIYLEQLDHVS